MAKRKETLVFLVENPEKGSYYQKLERVANGFWTVNQETELARILIDKFDSREAPQAGLTLLAVVCGQSIKLTVTKYLDEFK